MLSRKFQVLFLISMSLAATGALAQTPVPMEVEDIGPLPTNVSAEQLQSLQPLSQATTPPATQHVRRRLPRPVFALTPEEVSYRESIRKLGVNKNHFVHCELTTGKVRTGVIMEIRDNGFMLKDGIIISQWIPYTDLKAAPRAVPAVGTRIGQGFKWAGVTLGVVALIPLFPFAFLVWDGC